MRRLPNTINQHGVNDLQVDRECVDTTEIRDQEHVLSVIGLEQVGRDGCYHLLDLALKELALFLVAAGLEAGELGECVY